MPADGRAPSDLGPCIPPEALSAIDSTLQTALRSVLGQRGRWLSQFDKSWHWATTTLLSDDTVSEHELESQWNDGPLHARLPALDHVRRTSAELARKWLREAWPHEKAETRLDLLQTIAGSLSNDDVEFLESARNDRSTFVRACYQRVAVQARRFKPGGESPQLVRRIHSSGRTGKVACGLAAPTRRCVCGT